MRKLVKRNVAIMEAREALRLDLPTRVSIATASRDAQRDEHRTRLALARVRDAKLKGNEKKVIKAIERAKTSMTADSFVNFQQMLGIGADNAMSTSTYGFNPISRIRILLEWIHRGSWLGGMAVDVRAEDMTREGATLEGEITPEDQQKIEEAATTLKIWHSLCNLIKWARLYGGAVAIHMIDGQDYSTPMRIESIGPGDYKGLLVLDRWNVDPTLSDLVTEAGPELGLPKFYRIVSGSDALPNIKVHHSRVIRSIGIELPYQQKLMENLWGISVLERIYDRMVAFDSATTGAAQLVYKAWLRTYAIKDLRSIVASGGKVYEGLVRQVELMRRMASQEGITLIDSEDKMEAMQPSAYSGLADMILQFGQQVAGALQTPLVRLFGQSPAGLNSSGDSELHTYYDGIKKDQVSMIGADVTKIYRCIGRSEQIKLPEGFKTKFRPLYLLTETQKSEIAERDGRTIGDAEEKGLISQQTAMKELKKSGETTGRFTNITDDDIEAAETTLPPAGEEAMGAMGGVTLGAEAGEAKAGLIPSKKQAVKDTQHVVASIKSLHDLNVALENVKGSVRRGKNWQVVMPAHYGFFSGTNGRDGDEVDCWIGPELASQTVFVLRQLNPKTREYDEDKAMLGYGDMGAALSDYFAGYTDGAGWARVGGITEMTMADFKTWLGQKITVPA